MESILQRFIAGLAAAALLLPACAAAPDLETAGEAAAGMPPVEETWIVTKMGGVPVGYVHSRYAPEPVDGALGWRTEVDARFRMGRLGAEISIILQTVSLEDAQGRVRRIEMDTQFSNQPGRFVGVVEGDVLKARAEAMDQVREFEVPWDEASLSQRSLERLYAQVAAGAPGTTATAQLFDPTSAQLIEYRIENAGRETIDWRGAPVETSVILFETELMPGAPGKAWIDARGRNLRTLQPVMTGVEMVFELADQEEALTAYHGENQIPDVFAELLIHSNVRVPHPRRVDEAAYRVRRKEAAAEFPDFALDRRQSVAARDAGELLLQVRRREGPAGGYRLPLADLPPDVAAALQPSSAIQSDDPQLAAAARAAAGDEHDVWRAAQRLERWVYEHVDKKSMDVGFASALEVFRERRGDCSEHAVLLAAMCRAAGIPARVVMGWVYALGTFAGHAWTEVWAGDWYALDATLADGSVDATHIGLGHSILADTGGLELFTTVAQGISAVDIQVERLRYGQDWMELEELQAGFTVDGDIYRNTLLGLAFTKPRAWEYDDLIPKGFTTDVAEIEAPQGSDQFEINAVEVPYFFVLDDLTGTQGDGWASAGAITVDGRSAAVYERHDASRHERRVFVLTGDTLFTFSLRAGDPDSQALFDAFLGSVDFDL